MTVRAIARDAEPASKRSFWSVWLADFSVRIGAQISLLAVPLIAALELDASARQMGALVALASLPALIFGLAFGVWVDRSRRRRLLIGANLTQAALLTLVPVLWMFDTLTFNALVAVALGLGACRALFDIAFRTYVPSVIERDGLLRANSRLELGRSAAEIGGPGVAGVLLQVLAAPITLFVDAVARLCSCFFLASAPAEPPVTRDAVQRSRIGDALLGLNTVRRSAVLGPLGGSLAIVGFFNGAVEALFLLFTARELGLAPLTIGLIFAIGSAGFVAGAFLPERLAARFGLGWSLLGTLSLIGVSDLLVPLAGGPTIVIVALLTSAQFLIGIGLTAFSANEVTIRQATTPSDVLGRVNAAFYVLTHGSAPLGALLGGLAGSTLGLRAALLGAALGEMLAIIPLLRRSFMHAANATTVGPAKSG